MQNNWHAKEIVEIFDKFNVTKHGLSDNEVKKLREDYGENKLQETKETTLVEIFFRQFKSPLIYVLLIATVIVFFLKEVVDAIIIAVVIILNAIIGTVQEGRAQNTLAALSHVVKGKAVVLRDGKTKVIEDTMVVPGDILLLKDGDGVPADARILEANQLQVNESSLTGESNPVLKKVETLTENEKTPQEKTNMVFRGTYVVSGIGRALVVETGENTEIGQVATKLEKIESEIPLQKNIQNLSQLLIWVVIIFASLIFIAGLLYGNEPTEMFKTVVALAVSAIPEGLPVVVTLVLATGVWRMSKRNALVKRLQAVEALGQATVIALDKTGTITKNQMMVEKIWIDGEIYSITGDGYAPEGFATLRDEKVTTHTHSSLSYAARISAFTAIAEVVYDEDQKEWKSIMGDPTETALKVFAQKMGIVKEDLLRQYPLLHEIPFDFEAKHHTTVNTIDDEKFLSVAGSPEVLLRHASHIFINGESVVLTDEERVEVKKEMEQLSKQGYRLLGLGFNEHPDMEKVQSGNINGITFLGFVAITDVIRSDVPEAVQAARDAGMKVVMITGDNSHTAESIGARVGIYREGDRIVQGKEIAVMNNDELDDALEYATVFARVSPDHKLRIIEAYKRKGETIAMTGDGINDALSLVAADLGVAMGKVGTEVAQEAADIILLDDNFDNIRIAVEEGRSIYLTIRKAVLYMMSTNVGELFVIFFAIIFGWSMPLLASQIIWLNMVTDSFLVAALAMEPKEKGLLTRRMRKPSKYLIDKQMFFQIMTISGVMTVLTLAFFYYYSHTEVVDMTKAWTVTLTVLAVSQWFNVWNIRSLEQSIFEYKTKNMWILWGTIGAVGLHVFALYTPFMQDILKTTGLSIMEWFIIALASLLVIVVEEVRKFIAKKRKTAIV